MNDYVGSRVDRSFLYLMAIYIIHGILLHVFLRPINATGINIDKKIIQPILSDDWRTFVDNTNTSYIDIETNEKFQVAKNSNDVNAPIINQASFQGNPSDATLHMLSPSKSSGVSLNTASKCASVVMAAVKNISPATWGIISGCIVFLLTFTENDNIR